MWGKKRRVRVWPAAVTVPSHLRLNLTENEDDVRLRPRHCCRNRPLITQLPRGTASSCITHGSNLYFLSLSVSRICKKKCGDIHGHRSRTPRAHATHQTMHFVTYARSISTYIFCDVRTLDINLYILWRKHTIIKQCILWKRKQRSQPQKAGWSTTASHVSSKPTRDPATCLPRHPLRSNLSALNTSVCQSISISSTAYFWSLLEFGDFDETRCHFKCFSLVFLK